MTEDENVNETQTIPLEHFKGAKESSFEKDVFKGIKDAEVVSISAPKYNPKFGEGKLKNGRTYKKYYFTVDYLSTDEEGTPKEYFESYPFRQYDDDKSLWYGSEDSACGQLVSKIKKYNPQLSDNPELSDIMDALINKKVKIYYDYYGTNKSPKIMIDTFL